MAKQGTGIRQKDRAAESGKPVSLAGPIVGQANAPFSRYHAGADGNGAVP